MFREAGRTDMTQRLQALVYLQSTPKAEVEALVKAAWNAFLKLLCDLINSKWTPSGSAPPAPTPGVAYQSSEELFQALLDKSTARVENGKLVITFN